MLIETDTSVLLSSVTISGNTIYGSFNSQSEPSSVVASVIKTIAPSDPGSIKSVKIKSLNDGSTIAFDVNGKEALVDLTYLAEVLSTMYADIEVTTDDGTVNSIALPIAFLIGAYDYLNDGTNVYVYVDGGPVKSELTIKEVSEELASAISSISKSKEIEIIPVPTANVEPPMTPPSVQPLVATGSNTLIDVTIVANELTALIQSAEGTEKSGEITLYRLATTGAVLALIVGLMVTRLTVVEL